MASGAIEDNLTEVEAKARGATVSNASYKVDLTISRGASEYKGVLTVKFDYKSSDSALFLDGICKTVHKIEINNKNIDVSADVFKDNRIYFPKDGLKQTNEARIEFTNVYDKTGNGFHHFVDPEDNQEYIYTNFEPFYAHRLFPCFDQPDIKAKLELIVRTPREWVAVANDNEIKQEDIGGECVARYFAPTPPLSPYLYALVVGPYEKFEEKHGEISLGFYVRKSLKKFLEPDLNELTTITKQGLDFYNKFFDCAYPFSKYDQIFCPEYNIGAMENPGAVTFTERYIFRDPPTDAQRLRRADTFLHEMAHMWFGDLVSPVWWDGLWLNESFASYMAALAVAESTRFGAESWLEFHTSYKRWAYREDQLSTTHPIQGPVVDTNSTFQNFDGITYGKGASVLKQLVAVVGMPGFKAGMQHYFKKHPWGNTTIGDFLNAIEVGAKTNLKEWSQLWLESAGLNTLSPVWNTENGKIASFIVEQTADAPHTTLRPHHIEIVLYDVHNGAPKQRSSVQADISGGKTSIASLVGQAAPAAVFINHNDHAYAKVLLDKNSLDFFKNNVEKFDDTLTRQLVWSSFLTMVRDAQWPAQEFLELITSKVALETDPKLVQFIIRAAEATLASYLPDEYLPEHSAHFFKLCVKQLQGSKTQDERIVWARAAIGAGRQKENIVQLIDMMSKGTGASEGFELDQDMRWSIVQKASAYSIPNSDALAATEETRDASDRGKRAMECYRVCAADASVKEAAWNRFITDTTSSMKMINAAMGGFHWRNQRDILDPFTDKFFGAIQEIFKTREFAAAENFYNILFAGYRVDDVIMSHCEGLLSKLDASKDTILVRCLKESIDDIKRSRACHALAKSYAAAASNKK